MSDEITEGVTPEASSLSMTMESSAPSFKRDNAEKVQNFLRATPLAPAPIPVGTDALLENTVLLPNPELLDASAVKDGTVLVFTRETGLSYPPFDSRNRHAHRDNGIELEPGVDYVVGGEDGLPLQFAIRLFERGVLALK